MVFPGICNAAPCAGMHLQCPLCRENSCLYGMNLLRLVCGGQHAARARFQNKREGPKAWDRDMKRRREKECSQSPSCESDS
eukprot:3476619-Prymnesium_polylepis.1